MKGPFIADTDHIVHSPDGGFFPFRTLEGAEAFAEAANEHYRITGHYFDDSAAD